MKKSLITFLVAISILVPAFKEIDAYREYNTKSLVLNESIDTFNTESFYKIEC